MNEPYFCGDHLLLDRQPDVEGTPRLAKYAERVGGEYLQELAPGDDDIICSVGVRQSLYDQGPIFGGSRAGTVVQVRHRNDPRFVERDFDSRNRPERTMRQ